MKHWKCQAQQFGKWTTNGSACPNKWACEMIIPGEHEPPKECIIYKNGRTSDFIATGKRI